MKHLLAFALLLLSTASWAIADPRSFSLYVLTNKVETKDAPVLSSKDVISSSSDQSAVSLRVKPDAFRRFQQAPTGAAFALYQDDTRICQGRLWAPIRSAAMNAVVAMPVENNTVEIALGYPTRKYFSGSYPTVEVLLRVIKGQPVEPEATLKP